MRRLDGIRRLMRRSGPVALVACVMIAYHAGTALADDVGDPVAGRKLAEAWCGNCHVLDTSERAIATGAPSFHAVAADKAITPLALRAFLQTPHQRMPDLHLSNNETDDLIAYILSLRGG